MIKNFLVLILMLAAFSMKAQVIVNIQWQNIKPGHSRDTIYYDNDRKLIWADFKGRPDAGSWAAAITESGFGYQLAMTSYKGQTTINITVYCYFNKNKSWVKKGANNDYALLHEQHHFDITYINTCLFIQRLRAAKFTRSNCSSLSAQIHDECFAALNKMQDDYDGETSNGRIEGKQFTWNKRIDAELAALTTN